MDHSPGVDKKLATKTIFKNRAQVGGLLAKKVAKLKLENPVVLALANGGVVVGAEVAKVLGCPLEPVIAKKIFYPSEDSLGFGAVNDRGEVYLSQYAEGVPAEIIKYQSDLANKTATQRAHHLKKYLKKQTLANKTAVLVDDSLATGSTMMATLTSIKKRKPVKIIIAATIVSEQAIRLLRKSANKIIALHRQSADSFARLSDVYEDYRAVSDQEVIRILNHPLPERHE